MSLPLILNNILNDKCDRLSFYYDLKRTIQILEKMI